MRSSPAISLSRRGTPLQGSVDGALSSHVDGGLGSFPLLTDAEARQGGVHEGVGGGGAGEVVVVDHRESRPEALPVLPVFASASSRFPARPTIGTLALLA